MPPVHGRWQATGLSGGGVIHAPVISPRDDKMAMVECNMGNGFLSRDGAHSWMMFKDIEHSPGSSGAVGAFHPTNPDTIFVVDRFDGLKVTDDGGKSWRSIGNISTGLDGEIVIDPDNASLMFVGSTSGSLWRSEDGGKTWKRPGDGPSGAMRGFHFDRTSSVARRTCFVATSQGVWRSNDGGDSWTNRTGSLSGISDFAGGSRQSDGTILLYAATSTGLYRSSDRAASWQRIDTTSYARVLTNDVNPQRVYTFASQQVYRSDDGGSSFVPKLFPDPRDRRFNVEHDHFTSYMGRDNQTLFRSATIAPSNPDVIIRTTGMLLQYTRDGGDSWKVGHSVAVPRGGAVPKEFLNSGLGVTSAWHYYVHPTDPKRHYIAYTDIGYARSTDGGRTWRYWPFWGAGAIPWYHNLFELAFDPDRPQRMWGAFSQAHDIPMSNIIMGRHSANKPGGVAVSNDYGETWTVSNGGLPSAPVISIVVDPSSPKTRRTLYTSVFEHGVYKSTDDGASWQSVNNGLGANKRVTRLQIHQDGTLFVLVTASRQNGQFLNNGVGLYRSRNGATSWERVNTTRTFLWPMDFTVDPKDSQVIYLGAALSGGSGDNPGLWRTTNGGSSWQGLVTDNTKHHFGAYLHPNRPGWIYRTVAENHRVPGLWLSKDNGANWTAFEDLPFNSVLRVTVDPTNDDRIYVTTFGGGVFQGPADPNSPS
jgi:photosystem II stability/assembly factor-like uncharacterized protein